MCARDVRVVVDGGCATRRRSDAMMCAWLLRVSTDTDEHSRDACVFTCVQVNAEAFEREG